MENIKYLAEIIFIAGFVFAFFIDHLPLSFRVMGYKLNDFPLSTLKSSQIMILNRFGAALFFTSAGFLVDIGTSPKAFLLLFSLSWGFLGLLTLIYIRKWQAVSEFLALKLFNKENAFSTTFVINFSIKDFLTNFPFFFNLIGISAPVILAAFFPDFRATLLQIGFLFNSIATLLLVLIVEPRFIGHISRGEGNVADKYHQKLISSKAMILIAMSIISFGLHTIVF